MKALLQDSCNTSLGHKIIKESNNGHLYHFLGMRPKVSKDLPCLVKTPLKPETTWKGFTFEFSSKPKLSLFFDLLNRMIGNVVH